MPFIIIRSEAVQSFFKALKWGARETLIFYLYCYRVKKFCNPKLKIKGDSHEGF